MEQLVTRFGVGTLFVLSLTLAFLISAVGSYPQRSAKRINQRTAELFRHECARCHGADGGGDTPLGNLYKSPDFTDRDWWNREAKLTRSTSLISIVTHGRGSMPAFGKKLTRNEIRLLVNYVRRFRTETGPSQ
ncbi:MAG: cytochrome c [Pyrinomonadaceae bacterium]